MAKKQFDYQVKPFASIRQMVQMAADENGDKAAYMFKDKAGEVVSVSFREFCDVTEDLGAALCEKGLGSAHVACIGENSYVWITAYVTVLKSAGVFVPIDKELPPQDKNYLLTDSEAEAVFFSAKYEEYVRENREKLPNVRYFIGFDLEEDSEDGVFLSYQKLIERGKTLDKAEYDALKSDLDDLKMLVYTSGTTGIAKGVMLSEKNLVASVYYGLQVSTIFDRGLSVLPYNHAYEAVCDILVSIHNRSTLCVCPVLKDIVKDLKLYQPTHIYIVPALAEVLYASIMRNVRKQNKEKAFAAAVKITRAMLKIGVDLRPKLFKDIRDVFGGKLIKIVCGGAPIRPEIGEFFHNIGIALIGGYGITECSPLVSVNDEHCITFDTVGHRLPCLEWRIDDPNEEGIGEICVKGDVVMLGYYHMPEKTAEVLRDGWFSTGDYGYLTDDDMLAITGRKKNIIVLNNGKNIYPEEIENRIMNIEYITEVVVRGLKNERGDEYSLLAEVYMADAEKPEDVILSDVQDALRDLPEYKNVTKIVVRKEPFPKTTTNKIKR